MEHRWKYLTVKGDTICEQDGNVVAIIKNSSNKQSIHYARLFAAAPELASLLESVIGHAVDEFERQVAEARHAVPMTGVTRCGPDKFYTTLPDWVQNGLMLLRKIRDEA
jgi:hypothetical protein